MSTFLVYSYIKTRRRARTDSWILFYNYWILRELRCRSCEFRSQITIESSTWSSRTFRSSDNLGTSQWISSVEIITSEIVEIILLCFIHSTARDIEKGWTLGRGSLGSSDSILTHDRSIYKELIFECLDIAYTCRIAAISTRHHRTIDHIRANDICDCWTDVEISSYSIGILFYNYSENGVHITIVHICIDVEISTFDYKCSLTTDSSSTQSKESSITLKLHDGGIVS